MADDWEPVQQTQGDDWEAVTLAERPTPTANDALPEAFLDRLKAGQALGRVLSAAGKGAVEGAGQGTPTGFEDETLNHLIDLGIFHDPAKGRGGPLQIINEATMMPAAQAWDAINRAVSGGIHGAGGAMEQLVTEFGGSQGEAHRAKNEVIDLANWAMIEGGMGRFSRPGIEPGGVVDKPVGGLPAPQDFTNGARVLNDQPEGMPSLFAKFGETGRAPKNSSIEAPPGFQSPSDQVSTRPEPSGSSTTRPTTPLSTTEGPATIFGDLELGAIDGSSNKKILQGSNDYKALLATAERNKPKLSDALERVTDGIDGASVYGVRVKDEPGLVEKIQTKGRAPSTISDYLGARIVADTPEAMNAVLSRFESTGAVIEAENFVHSPKAGYRAYHLQVGLGDGTSAEIQVVPRPIADKISETHAIRQPFKRMAEASPEGMARFKEAMERAIKISDDAWTAAKGWPESTIREVNNPVATTQENLRRMWSEDGIHPAEAVHDAQTDGFVKHEITAPSTIIAYHGSGREFDRFNIEMMGGGEGAQAYGPGLYFAENPKVAGSYIGLAGGKPLPSNVSRALDSLGRLGFDTNREAISAIREDAKRGDWRKNWDIGPEDESAAKVINDYLSRLPSLGRRQDTLYQVRINANQEHFLDYDKPLSQQPEITQKLQSLYDKLGRPENVLRDYGTGGEVINDFARNLIPDPQEASRLLNEAGIPGIKYLDAGSRGNEGGHTRNFVVFNHDDIEITHKNGIPVETVPKDWVKPEEMEEAFGRAASLSAAVTDPADIPPDVQPPRPAGSLIASAQKAADTLFDVGRDIQMKLAPMARGSVESMATVKDYMNAMRRNAWDASRIDIDLQKKFTPEQRARMWNAMDEESLSLRLEEPASAREHQGLATLSPEERAAVLDLDTRQQLAWLRARDLGMVEGDGIPMHAPRMVLNAKSAAEREGAMSLTALGYDLRTRTPGMRQRKYMEVEETERAAKAKYGEQAIVARDIRTVNIATSQLEAAVAGRTLIENIKEVGKRTGDETVAEGFQPDKTWFTVDHPSFKTWRPKFQEVDGRVEAIKDAEGKPVFEQVPIYVRGDFEGPLRAAMWGKTGDAYGAMMALKGKTMGLIMNSPMIHNLVEFGRAFPAMPTRIVKAYFDGNRAKNDPAIMHEAIDSGLVPIGKRFFNQDINAVMEAPDLTPGRSFTAKVLAAVPGLFDEAAGTAVKQAIDKAGDFWHNTLLWDRIADLQAGLYVNFRGDLMARGMDQTTASRIAAHFANRYAGALPKEAMSEAATKVSNFLFFSRSFTFGNLGVMKDMLTGLPKDVLAQIERDAGFKAGSIDQAGNLNGPEQIAVTTAKSMARRKAMAVVALDVALMYVGNSVLQSAFNVMLGDSTLTQEGHEYLRRARDVLNEVSVHPLSLLQPMQIAERLSATGDNEPSRRDRVKIGYAKDGTAIYARNPVGKIGEEFANWFTSPLDMLRKKEGTIARPLLQIFTNDAGFGRKIYDPQADTPAAYAGAVWASVKHLVASQLPVGQITAFSDLVKGEGDKTVNALQAFGPFAGVTFSKGAPGGPAVGELYDARSRHEFAVNQAMPDIKKQILRGDLDGARSRMTELDINQGLQRWYIRSTLNPATRMSPRAMRDFQLYSTDEQKARMGRARQAQPQP